MRILQDSPARGADTDAFLAALQGLLSSTPPQEWRREEVQAVREALRPGRDVAVGRAPGRLDVMGGIADYSGSLVLQMPIKEACHVALQFAPARCRGEGRVTVVSLAPRNGDTAAQDRDTAVSLPLAALVPGTPTGPNSGYPPPLEYEAARAYFQALGPGRRWSAYAVGTLLVLARERARQFNDSWQNMSACCSEGEWDGVDVGIVIMSDVPAGKGVASSASVEVATMSALLGGLGMSLPGRDLAILCQMVENRVVGAPCGVMDQMASALGRKDTLLALLCQPAEVLGYVPVPASVALWGVDSGVKHALSAGGSDYATVRTAAFMGRRIIQKVQQARGQEATEYLCNIRPHSLDSTWIRVLPESMLGQDFLAQYGSHGDEGVTTVQPSVAYPVRAAACHPVREHFRVLTFAALLRAAAPGNPGHAPGGVAPGADKHDRAQDEQLTALGELMLQSHASYTSCGLGSEGTDQLVDLASQHMPSALVASASAPSVSPLLGAKITGGGSGGTVCILGRSDGQGAKSVASVCDQYAQQSGHKPYVFSGSSSGAMEFQHMTLRFV